MIAKNHCLMKLRDKGKYPLEINERIAATPDESDEIKLLIEKDNTLNQLNEALHQLNKTRSTSEVVSGRRPDAVVVRSRLSLEQCPYVEPLQRFKYLHGRVGESTEQIIRTPLREVQRTVVEVVLKKDRRLDR